MKTTEIRTWITSALLAAGMFASAAATAERVGEIKYARGAVTVQQADGSGARLIGQGDNLNQGEVVKTGSKSFAILRLEDDTRMTLRPGTSFAVEEYTAQRNSKASALLRLFRGGMRTITGFISKMNPGGYKIKTATATIGIRGTEFDARLCAQDCAEENQKLDKRIASEAKRTVAKAVFIRGDVKANNFLDKERSLVRLSPIFEGDTIITGEDSYTILIFRDKSRVSLQEDTQFRVDELRYQDDADKTGVSGLFSLLRGGLRTITGLIGKVSPDKYRMRTTVATLGIRGTGYDMLCTGPCAADGAPAKTPMPNGDGLYTHVWDGEVMLGDQAVGLNQAAFVQNKAEPARILQSVPSFFIDNPLPKPNTIEVDESTLFEAKKGDAAPEGLYVSVKEGEVIIKSDTTDELVKITKGQAAFASIGGQLLQQLPTVPAFQQYDAYPSPGNLTPKGLEVGGALGDIENKDMVCEIQ